MSTRIITGDCRDVLPTLEAESFDCIVTSPPYFGLRSYLPDGHLDKAREIGCEPTLDAYVETMAVVGRELWRVLKPSGVFWLNLGESYAANRTYQVHNTKGASGHTYGAGSKVPVGLKPKDLCLVPARVALRLQGDGWWIRSEIIWHKPAPMPESVLDRPTRSHEMVYMLTKSERYFFDAKAIAEPLARPDEANRATPAKFGGAAKFSEAQKQSRLHSGNEYKGTADGTRNARDVWTISSQPFSGSHFATMPPALAERCIKAGCPSGGHVLDPFGGAGTTGLVADRLGRNATLIDLNPGYREMQRERIEGDAPLFAQVSE